MKRSGIAILIGMVLLGAGIFLYDYYVNKSLKANVLPPRLEKYRIPEADAIAMMAYYAGCTGTECRDSTTLLNNDAQIEKDWNEIKNLLTPGPLGFLRRALKDARYRKADEAQYRLLHLLPPAPANPDEDRGAVAGYKTQIARIRLSGSIQKNYATSYLYFAVSTICPPPRSGCR